MAEELSGAAVENTDLEERLLDAAVNGRLEEAQALLDDHRRLSGENIWLACACGNSEAVAKELKANPALGSRVCPYRGWEPLLYCCYSHLHKLGGARAQGIRVAAHQLLDNGADANESWVDPAWPDARLTALLGATGDANHPELAELLLKAGADPNDGESLPHAAEHMYTECLELLLKYGVDVSLKSPVWDTTPLYFLLRHIDNKALYASSRQGIAWLLEHGAEPNTPCGPDGESALMRACGLGQDAATVELLLKHGADQAQQRADGMTAWRLAARRGNTAACELLAAHGAQVEELTTAERLTAACCADDEAEAQRIVRSEPDIIKSLGREDRSLICEVAALDRTRTLRLLLTVGWDVHTRGLHGGTPLHIASWHGWSMNAGVLLEHGANHNLLCEDFGATPLYWAAHGSRHCTNPAGNYKSTVTLLCRAGADLATANRWGETPDAAGTDEVRKLIEEQRRMREG